MLTLTHNGGMFTVKGTLKDSEGSTVHIAESTFHYERTLKAFNYYSTSNGFKGKRLNLVPDNLRK